MTLRLRYLLLLFDQHLHITLTTESAITTVIFIGLS